MEGNGFAVISGGAAPEGRDLVEAACEAGAEVVECGVRAEEALARGLAGAAGVRPAVGETGAKGRGVGRGGQHMAGPASRHPRPGAGRVAGHGALGRQSASGTP